MPRRPGYRQTNYDTSKGDSRLANPHSEWQLLIEASRTKLDIGIRNLGRMTSIPQGTLFAWLRSAQGGPPGYSYTAEVNARLAAALKIKPEKLAAAYEASRKDRIFEPLLPAPKLQEKPSRTAAAPSAPSTPANPVTYRKGPPVRKAARGAATAGTDSLNRLLAMLDASGKDSFTLDEIHHLASIVDPSLV